MKVLGEPRMSFFRVRDFGDEGRKFFFKKKDGTRVPNDTVSHLVILQTGVQEKEIPLKLQGCSGRLKIIILLTFSKTKIFVFYLNNQLVPRSEHSPSRLQFMNCTCNVTLRRVHAIIFAVENH